MDRDDVAAALKRVLGELLADATAPVGLPPIPAEGLRIGLVGISVQVDSLTLEFGDKRSD